LFQMVNFFPNSGGDRENNPGVGYPKKTTALV